MWKAKVSMTIEIKYSRCIINRNTFSSLLQRPLPWMIRVYQVLKPIRRYVVKNKKTGRLRLIICKTKSTYRTIFTHFISAGLRVHINKITLPKVMAEIFKSRSRCRTCVWRDGNFDRDSLLLMNWRWLPWMRW